MEAKDIQRPRLAELDWSPAARSGSLTAVFEHAIDLCVDSEEWYERNRRSKRRGGRILRVGALMFVGVGAILPILSEIWTTNAEPAIAPGWAAVAIALAGLLVAFDRYFGFSTAWMRYTSALLSLARLRQAFEYRWQLGRLREHNPPTVQEVTELLAEARSFALAVHDVVANETTTWITEFQSSLERAEQQLSASR